MKKAEVWAAKIFLTVLSVHIITLGLSIEPHIGLAEVTVSSYCQLTIAEMQQQISDYQELISLANQYKDDPTTLAQQEAMSRAQFDQEKEARYRSFGTTSQEYVLYMGKNASAVETYLKSNPVIKQQMDNLITQLISFSEEHSALKKAINQ